MHHPDLGRLTSDRDALHVPDVVQALVVRAAAPGTAEAESLALLRDIGLQDMEHRDTVGQRRYGPAGSRPMAAAVTVAAISSRVRPSPCRRWS